MELPKGAIPLPQPLKQKIKDGIVAVSLANLIFVRSSFDMLFDDDRFYNKTTVTATDLLALMFNILWVAAVIWLGMRAVHRFRNTVAQLALHMVFFSLLLIPADFVRAKFYGIADYQIVMFIKQPVVFKPGSPHPAGLMAASAGGHRRRGPAGNHVVLWVRNSGENHAFNPWDHTSAGM